MFDIVIDELQRESIIFSGELLTPNHFRISAKGTDFMKIISKLKKNSFSFLNMNSPKGNHLKEFFFNSIQNQRDYLISLVIPRSETSDLVLNSMKHIFPSAEHIEKYFNDN